MKRLLVLLAACGSSHSGEPQMGTATVQYGSTTRMMTTGSAIMDTQTPGNMIIQLGDDGVSCSTNLNQSLDLSGMFATMSVSSSAPGTNPNADITVIYAANNNINIEGASGMVTVDAIDTRVTGSVTFTTTGSAGTISATGTFDVKKCF